MVLFPKWIKAAQIAGSSELGVEDQYSTAGSREVSLLHVP
jgi:hypothetical protein